MNTPHLEHIDTAFLQLSFAIKLWHFLGENPLDVERFDIPLTIEDDGWRVALPHNQFTPEALQVATYNNVSICFGTAAITLWEAIRERTGIHPRAMDPNNGTDENLAALSYMIRCCFAHGPASPVWSIRDGKYRTTYQVGNKSIDLSNVAEGQRFDYRSIGGYETLWFLKDEARVRGML